MLFRHSMSIAQQLMPIYNTTVHKNKINETLNLMWLTAVCLWKHQQATRAVMLFWHRMSPFTIPLYIRTRVLHCPYKVTCWCHETQTCHKDGDCAVREFKMSELQCAGRPTWTSFEQRLQIFLLWSRGLMQPGQHVTHVAQRVVGVKLDGSRGPSRAWEYGIYCLNSTGFIYLYTQSQFVHFRGLMFGNINFSESQMKCVDAR